MRITVLISNALLLISLLILSSVSTPTVQAAQSAAKNAQPQSSTAKASDNGAASADQGKNAGAGKVVEDPLKACMSRIPANSSKGQRLLAEQGCQKEQDVRSSRRAAPEF